jgi:hypothetical protein
LRFHFARLSAGKSMAAKMAMIAMITKSSIRVTPREPILFANREEWMLHCAFSHPTHFLGLIMNLSAYKNMTRSE